IELAEIVEAACKQGVVRKSFLDNGEGPLVESLGFGGAALRCQRGCLHLQLECLGHLFGNGLALDRLSKSGGLPKQQSSTNNQAHDPGFGRETISHRWVLDLQLIAARRM